MEEVACRFFNLKDTSGMMMLVINYGIDYIVFDLCTQYGIDYICTLDNGVTIDGMEYF
jgi:hypothetical protein